jgi:hypothetical protein
VTKVSSVGNKVLKSAQQVIDDQSMDYTLDEVDEELQLMTQHSQQLKELIAAGRRDDFAGHPDFEEAQRAVMGENKRN